jgi:hypothetical protein
MRLTPRPPDIGPMDGFKDDVDIFGYADFGNCLANVVSGLDQPLTILMDGPWGSGKSTFMRQWAGLLRNQGMAVIEFDAFANDHHDDAFLALAGEILELAKTVSPAKAKAATFKAAATSVGRVILRHGANALVRAATFNAVDAASLGSTGVEIEKAMAEKSGDAMAEVIKDRLDNHRKDADAFTAFRDTLKELAEAMTQSPEEGQGRKPLVLIIDELDRCRPPFALSLLERIKHLFSVDGVVFVLVTNLEQLRAAVCGAYGPETDGRLYLDKFYHLRATLPTVAPQRASVTQRYLSHLWSDMALGSGREDIDHQTRTIIEHLATIHQLSLRSLERVATHVALAHAADGLSGQKWPLLVAGLAVMRQVEPGLFAKARSGRLTWAEVEPFFRFERWPDDRGEWSADLWQRMTDPGYRGAEPGRYNNLMFQLGVDSMTRLPPIMAGMIDGFTMAP